jgi:uncharacterized membrane protein YedE/YeeE
MDWSQFTPVSALVGGALLGAGALLLWALSGRTAGISGMISGLLLPARGEVAWRALFLSGMLLAGLGAIAFAPTAIGTSPRSLATLALAGLLVGFGTKLANGCTSGHGLCGVARLSPRSLVATVTFVGFGMLTVALARVALGLS